VITFKNGHRLDFACASGALAWMGEGWWWERPLRWLGYIRPDELTVISKTLTYEPRIGNLRWWCPWRCVRLIEDGAVNAVGLTNPGYKWWINKFPKKIIKKGWKVIVSIMPNSPKEAAEMARALNSCPIVGIEINLSCPNVDHDTSIKHVKDIVFAVLENTIHPVIVKLSYTDPYKDICVELDGKVAAFDLINTIIWTRLFPDKPSPLSKYGLIGGVSGIPLKEYSREALASVLVAGVKTPIISGGGIDSVEEVFARRIMGAKAYTLGTVFLRSPWKPKHIIRECRETWSRERNEWLVGKLQRAK
jgi:dihydroorotate dehydrogenase (NAD+) catalytic subunit